MSTIRLHPDTMREAVRRVPFLARLSPASIEALVSLLGARRLGEDEVLYKEGDPGDALMMVVSGRLSVRVRSTASTQDAEVAAVSTPGRWWARWRAWTLGRAAPQS